MTARCFCPRKRANPLVLMFPHANGVQTDLDMFFIMRIQTTKPTFTWIPTRFNKFIDGTWKACIKTSDLLRQISNPQLLPSCIRLRNRHLTKSRLQNPKTSLDQGRFAAPFSPVKVHKLTTIHIIVNMLQHRLLIIIEGTNLQLYISHFPISPLRFPRILNGSLLIRSCIDWRFFVNFQCMLMMMMMMLRGNWLR